MYERYFENKNVKEDNELAPSRDAFRNMSINPSINPIVDLGNSISIKYCLPVEIHDLNTMDIDFCVRIANENVKIGLINSENKEYETK